MAYNNPYHKPAIIRRDLVTDVMAMDCEMVVAEKGGGTLNFNGDPACWNPAGRCSITNSRGDVVLDCRIHHPPSVKIVHPNTLYSGLTWADLKPHNGALPFDQARNTVIDHLQGRTVVGHDLHHDLKAMDLTDVLQAHSIKTADTQRLYGSMDVPPCGTRPKLSDLAHECLARTIQTSAHDSIEDAGATMDLYNYYNSHHADEEAELRREKLATKLQARHAHRGSKDNFKTWDTIPDPRPDADGFVEVHSNCKRKFIRKHQNAHDQAKAARRPEDDEDTTGWARQVPELPWLRGKQVRPLEWKRPRGPCLDIPREESKL